MQETVFTQFILPGVLALVMLGMGLGLNLSDFSRLVKMPRAVIVGLVGQLLILPAFALCLALLFQAPSEIAIGLMIIAACPGGTTSNLISHVAKANLALSVTLTAITTIICVITTPLLIKYSIGFFEQQRSVDFSLLSTSLGLLVISIIPVIIGMAIRAKYSKSARRAEPFFRKLSTVFMLLLIAIISYQERDMLLVAFPDVFLLAMSLNIGATALGLVLAHLSKVSARDGVTLGIEIGTQNATLAILIAVTFIQEPAFAIAAGVYGVTMYLGAFLLVMARRSVLTAPE
ncbi:bile acid:sodium symporter family protein [Glaciecola siphonariae]|uniref:Bile acid:sodium symporter family protein n=1 Tax=Glaciecola siphonariae TaxID=521012 RepID=A0ABV9LUI6_9ALTE